LYESDHSTKNRVKMYREEEKTDEEENKEDRR
jgi:hypothetical protein